MNPWVAFVIGLLLGWLIEWVIDWVYWRRRGETAGASADASSRITRLEGDIAGLRAENRRLENLLSVRDAELLECNNRLSLSMAEAAPVVMDTRAVDMPVIEEPVMDRPVVDMADVDVTVPEVELAEDDIPVFDMDADIANVRLSNEVLVEDDLTSLSGIDSGAAERLHRAGIFTFAGLGALRPAALRSLLGDYSLTSGDEIEIVKNARMRSGSLRSVDDLEIIDGIGPVIAKILYNNGVFSFADVAELTPEQLREIVGERIQRLANEDKILGHARQLAGRE